MPTAQPFNALGKGNGFNRCLRTTTVSGNNILNPPTFEQTVGAYWNFHSASFSGASFEPGNEPRDLICTEGAAFGYDSDNSIGPPSERFSVSNGVPGIVKDAADDETIYYEHGIQFSHSTGEDIDGGNGVKLTTVDYRSTIAGSPAPIPYSCTVLNNTTSGGTTYSIGKVATQMKVAVSSVDIGGLPFIKTVTQYFQQATFDDPVGSGSAECAPASFLPAPSEVPSLTLWDY
tara:strand:- start:485 stop:1180 length:696 start_codon:yes stop_codon:yes gene_type:complete